MSSYTGNHLVEQPAIQLMQHEPGWEETGEILDLKCWILNGRERRMKGPRLPYSPRLRRPRKLALLRLNSDLPMDHSSPWLRTARAIDGVVDEEILNDGFWILNGRRPPTEPRLNQFRPALSGVEANRGIDKLLKGGVKLSFADRKQWGQRIDLFESASGGWRKSLKIKGFLFKLKTSA